MLSVEGNCNHGKEKKVWGKWVEHGITKYGIHSLTQIVLAMDKELTNWQDSVPDWLSKSSRQVAIDKEQTYTVRLST